MRNRPALLLCLSAALLTPAPGAASQESADLRIEVTRHAGDDAWSATYELGEPTTYLRFPDNTNLFRHASWKVESAGIELVVHEGFEVIRATHGTPFDTVAFTIPHQPEHLDRNYEFHVPYSDGSVLLFTGHFEVHSAAGPLTTELSLRGRENEHIYVDGAAHEAITARHDKDGFGTYAYFGSARPIETDDVVALIDPGLPEWIRDESERYLPQLFALYTQRFEVDLDSRPLVFFSYIEGAPGMADFSGGALAELIQLTVMGRAWAERGDGDSFERLLAFLAHESVHLWNRPTGPDAPGPGSAWMHEGSADALSFRALVELGVIDRERLLMWHARAIQRAAQRLAGTSVRESGSPELSLNFYEAGSALALATELAIQEAHAELDLFDFWRELLAAAHANGTSYTQAHYYALADRMAPESGIGDRLRAFVETRHEDPTAAFMDLFAPFAALRIELDWESGDIALVPTGGR